MSTFPSWPIVESKIRGEAHHIQTHTWYSVNNERRERHVHATFVLPYSPASRLSCCQQVFLEVMNSVLMTGEIPGLFAKDEMMAMTADLRNSFLKV